MNLFTMYIDKYCKYYNIFIELDRIKKTNELINLWCNTQETIIEVEKCKKYGESERESILKIVIKTQKKYEDKIKMFDKKFDMSKLKPYYDLKIRIKQNLEKIFFKKLEEDIRNEKYDHLEKILMEIHDQLLKLQPPKMKKEFIEGFDIELIKQLIKNNAFKDTDFIEYANYLIDIITKLEAPIKVKITKETWKDMLIKITNGEIGGFDKVIPFVFKYIYKKIEEINDDIITFYIMTNLGINVFAL